MPEPTKGGPQPGRQRRVKYCPNCKGDIHPIPTNKKKKKKDAESHAYLCDVCDWVFEINELRRERP